MLYIRTHNLIDLKDFEIKIPDRYILGGWSTYDEWTNFSNIYNNICDLKKFYLLQDSLSVSVLDSQKNFKDESSIELKVSGYEYLLTILEGTIIFESLVKDQEIIALRTDEPSEVILNREKITESEFEIYDALKDNHSSPCILTVLGNKLLKNLNNIICFQEKDYYITEHELQSEFDILSKKFGIDTLSIINKYLPLLHPNLKLTENYEFDYGIGKLSFNSGSSGEKRFCRLIPYLEVTRKENLILNISVFDHDFHPVLTKRLISEFIGPDFRIITRIHNLPSEFVSNPYICKNETNVENKK